MADALGAARGRWRTLAAAKTIGRDTAKDLGDLISQSKVAASTSRSGAILLVASHCLACGLLASDASFPSEPEFRFAGFAAVAVSRLGLLNQPEIADPLERAVATRFIALRGRLRGSTMIPRNVEYAFAGDVAGLEPVALDPAQRAPIDKLLAEGFRRRGQGGEWPPGDAEFGDTVAGLLG